MDDIFALKRQLLDEVEQSLFFSMKLERIRELAQKIAEKDPEFILKTCVFARNHLNIRKGSNDLFSCAAELKQCAPFLVKYVFSSINLPKDWLEVLSHFKTQHRPIPAALRKALALKFKQFDEYQLAKYNTAPRKVKRAKAQQKLYKRMVDLQTKYNKSSGALKVSRRRVGVGVRNRRRGVSRKNENSFVIKMKRPEPIDPDQLGVSMKQAISFLHLKAPVEHVMSILGRRYPGDIESFTRSGLSGEFDPSRANKRMKLAIPETWETLVSREGNVAKTWETLLADKKLPFMAMLRNIRNFIFTGMGDKYHDLVLEKLQNETAVANSRQFPFQFLNAYNEVPKDLAELRKKVEEANNGDESKNVKPRKRPFPRPSHDAEALLERYRGALSRAVELSANRNILPIEGCSDILFVFSPANIRPRAPRRGQAAAGKLSEATPAVEKSALLALLCAKACERASVFLPNGQYTVDTRVDLMSNISRVAADGVLYDDQQLDKLFVDHVYKLVTQRVHRTSLFLITDNMFDAKKVEFALNLYRKHVNPELLFVYISCGKEKVNFSFDDKRHNIIASASASEAVLRFLSTNNGDMTFVENLAVSLPKGLEEETEKRAVPLPYRSGLRFIPASATIDEDANYGLRATLPWKTVKIFVSSTFVDFQTERDILVNEVIPVLRERAAQMRVRVYDIDLRWGVLENAPPLPLCLRLVDESQIFLGFLGHRYGQPADVDALAADKATSAWAQQFRGRSVTELEFRRGLLSEDSGCKHHGFVYVRDDQTLDTLPEDVLGLFTSATPAQRAQVAALRKLFTDPATPELANCVVPYHAVFDHVETLPQARTQASVQNGGNQRVLLKGLNDLKARLMDDLWDAIVSVAGDNAKLLNSNDNAINVEDESDIEGSCDSSVFDETLISDNDDDAMDVEDDKKKTSHNPPITVQHQLCTNSEADVINYAQHFIGRKYFVEEIETFCLQQGFGSLALCGRDGCGSTALLAKLAVELQRYYQTSNRTNVSTFTCVYFPGRTTSLKDLLLDIAARLGVSLAANAAAAAGMDLTEVGNKFVRALRSRSESTRITLFVNDLDRVPQALDWLSAVGTLPCRLVFAVRCGKELLGCPTKDIPTLKKDETVAFIERTFRDFGKTVSPKQVRTLASKSDAGLPLYLSLACEEIRVHNAFETIDKKFANLPQRLKDLVQKEVIPRLLCIGQEGGAPANQSAVRDAQRVYSIPEVLLCAIVLSKNGLGERELLAYANAAAVTLSGSTVLSIFLPRLERIVKRNKDGRYYFPYTAVVEAVTTAFGLQRDAAQWHQRLAELLSTRDEVEAQSERAYQLTQVGTLPALRQATDVLCSVRHIEACIKAEERHTPARQRLPLRVANDLRDLRNTLKSHLAAATANADAVACAALSEIVARTDECCEIFETAGGVISMRRSSFIQYCLGCPATSALFRDAKDVLAAERRAAKALPQDAASTKQHKLPSLLLRQAFMSTITNKDTHQGALVATFAAAHAAVTALCFSGDSRFFAVGNSFGAVKVYSVADTALVFVLGGISDSAVTSIAFSGFLDRIAVGYASGKSRVYRLATPAKEPRELVDFREFPAHLITVSALAFFGANENAQFLITGSFDRSVAVWNAETLECVCKLRGYRKPVTDVVLRGNRVLTTSWDGQVSMYHINELNKLVPDGELRADGHLRRACFAGARAAETLVLGVGMDGSTLFDTEQRRSLFVSSITPRAFDVAETMQDDGTRLVASASDSDLTLLDAFALGRRRLMEASAELGELQCDPSGEVCLVYVNRTTNTVYVAADKSSGAKRLSLEGLQLAPACLTFVKSNIMYTVGSELYIHQNRCNHRSFEFQGDIAAIAGTVLLSATKNDLRLYDITSKGLVQTSLLRFENASAVCVDASANTLCAGSRGGDLVVYERGELGGEYVVRYTRNYPAASCTALALVDGCVVAGFSNGTLMRIDGTEEKDKVLNVHRGGVAKIVPYENRVIGKGTCILTLGSDGSVYLVNNDVTRVVLTLAQKDAVSVCCENNSSIFLSKCTGELSYIEEITFCVNSPVATVKAHDFVVTKTRFSPDARLLLSGDAEGVTKLWDVGRAVEQGTRSRVVSSAFFGSGREPSGSESKEVKAQSTHTRTTTLSNAVGTLVEHGSEFSGKPFLTCSDCTQFSQAPLSVVVVLAEKRAVACGYESGELALFRFDGSLLCRLEKVSGAVRCITPVYKAHKLTELAVGDELGALTCFTWNNKSRRNVLHSGMQGISSANVYEVGFRYVLQITPDFSADCKTAFYDYITQQHIPRSEISGYWTFYRSTASAVVSPTCALHGTYQGWVFMTFVDDKTSMVVPITPLVTVSSKPISGLALVELKDAPEFDRDGSAKFSLRFLASAGNVVYDCTVGRYTRGGRLSTTVTAVHIHPSEIVAFKASCGVIITSGVDGEITVTNSVTSVCHCVFQLQDTITTLDVSFRDGFIFAGSKYGKLNIFSYRSGKVLKDDVIKEDTEKLAEMSKRANERMASSFDNGFFGDEW